MAERKPKIQKSGLDAIMKNLAAEMGKIEGNTKIGLDSAAQHLMLEAMSRAPDDTGNLKDSADHKPFDSNKGFGETVIFAAEYAAAVHEMPGTLKGQPRANFGKTKEGVDFGGGSGKGHYWDQGEPHFLSIAIVENFTVILKIIKRFASRN